MKNQTEGKTVSKDTSRNGEDGKLSTPFFVRRPNNLFKSLFFPFQARPTYFLIFPSLSVKSEVLSKLGRRVALNNSDNNQMFLFHICGE